MNNACYSERYNERITRAVGVEWSAYHEAESEKTYLPQGVFLKSRGAFQKRELS